MKGNSHGFVHNHREAGGFGSPAHEAHTLAPEESLACLRVPGQEDTYSQIPFSPLALVAETRQCAQRPTTSSSAAHSSFVYWFLKRRLGLTPR